MERYVVCAFNGLKPIVSTHIHIYCFEFCTECVKLYSYDTYFTYIIHWRTVINIWIQQSDSNVNVMSVVSRNWTLQQYTLVMNVVVNDMNCICSKYFNGQMFITEILAWSDGSHIYVVMKQEYIYIWLTNIVAFSSAIFV